MTNWRFRFTPSDGRHALVHRKWEADQGISRDSSLIPPGPLSIICGQESPALAMSSQPAKKKSRHELIDAVSSDRRSGKRIVFTNGCFDLLHVGHVRYLQAARALGDRLIVGVNTDRSVRSLSKGPDRPIVPEAQRAEVLAALACVDYVTLFDEPTPLALIAEVQPDVLVKGGDWKPEQIVGRDLVEARGGRVIAIPLTPDASTTGLITKIRAFTP